VSRLAVLISICMHIKEQMQIAVCCTILGITREQLEGCQLYTLSRYSMSAPTLGHCGEGKLHEIFVPISLSLSSPLQCLFCCRLRMHCISPWSLLFSSNWLYMFGLPLNYKVLLKLCVMLVYCSKLNMYN